MAIRVFNTLTRNKEPFQPLEEGKVKMYVCGPTVYNYIHIGNARPAIVFDTVRRYFEYRGYDVHYVLNFTDVDDKLIKAANEMGEGVTEVANRFITAYKEDVGAFGVKEAVDHPRVTENMDEIVEFIEGLIEKGLLMNPAGMSTSAHVPLTRTGNCLISRLMNYVLVPELRSGTRKRTRLTSRSGRMRSPGRFLGKALGEQADRDGISNALRWLKNI